MKRPIRRDLLGRKPSDWRTYISVCAPSLSDSGEIISLNDEYFLSMGVHATHQHLLMERAARDPLTVEKSLAATALVAFATDSPIIPGHSQNQTQYASPNVKRLDREFKRAGFQSVGAYFEALTISVDAVSELTDIGVRHPALAKRLVPHSSYDTWAFLAWPSSDRTWRALSAYSTGLISISLPGRILNFWRSVEAVTGKAQRYTLFDSLHSKRIRPVWTTIQTARRGRFHESTVNRSILA